MERMTRRTLVRTLAALPALPAFSPAAALAQPGTVTQAEAAAAMTTPRGDAGQTGRMPGPGPAGAPVEVWRASGLLTEFYGFYGPLAANDLVYAIAPGPPRSLRAFDAATGAERWQAPLGGLLFLPSATTFADGVLYTAGREDEEPRRPMLMALDAQTGAERWRAPIGGQSLHEGHPPVAAGGVVYVASTNGALYAVDAATGEQRWSTPAVVGGAPALTDGVLVILHADGLLALDSATGEERWRAGHQPWGNVAGAGGQVYVVSRDDVREGGTLHALDAASGDDRWSFDGGSGLFGDPAIADGILFAGGPGGLFALDAATGEARWERPDLVDVRTAAVVGDTVYATDETNLIALNGADGAERWTVADWNAPFGGEHANLGGPIVVGGRVFLLTTDGELVAFASDEGS